jgi:hypothetical protein
MPTFHRSLSSPDGASLYPGIPASSLFVQHPITGLPMLHPLYHMPMIPMVPMMPLPMMAIPSTPTSATAAAAAIITSSTMTSPNVMASATIAGGPSSLPYVPLMMPSTPLARALSTPSTPVSPFAHHQMALDG